MNRSDHSYTDRLYSGSTNLRPASYSKYHGLINQGSTCYLNSVLQVLFMTKEFREAIESYCCDSKSLDFHLKDLFNELKSSTATTNKLTEVLGISKDFLQSDAAECFENILSKVTNPEASELFQGLLKVKNTCSKCKAETISQDPFWSLPLELEDCYDDYYVENGVENYFKESDLREGNQLYCECCSTKSDSTIKIEMKYHPKVLTLLLKRFKFDYRFGEHVKVRRCVQIPEILHIPPYGEMSPFYQLYAYVEHCGDLRNGHYIVTIKPQDDDWYTFNDNIVSLKPCQPFSRQNYEKNSRAYLFFYRKLSATNSLNDNGTSTSRCSKSDQPNKNDFESKEGQKSEKDRLMSTSDKPTENIKLPEIDSNNSNMGRHNKQVFRDRRQSKEDVDNLHNKEQQAFDWKQDADVKLSESLPSSLCDEDSAVSKSDTREQHRQTERQEQEKAAAGAEYSDYKEKERINKGENQKGNNKIDKQKVDQEKIRCDFGSEHKRLTKYDLVQQSVMSDFQKNTSKINPEYEKIKTTTQNGSDVCNRTHGNRSNGQTQSNRREVDGECLTSRIDQHQKNLVSNTEKPGRCGQQRTEMSFVLNKPTEGKKPSQKRKIRSSSVPFQHVELWGKNYEVCEMIVDDKNEKYLLLKERYQESGENFSKLKQCFKPECNINKLSYHIHIDSSEEPCRKSSEWKRNATKMQTGGTSDSYSCGTEVSQETGSLNQPTQRATVPACALNQNQITNSFQSSTANETSVKEFANAESNYPSVHPSKDTTSSFLHGSGGTGAHRQQSSGAGGHRNIDSLSSDLQIMSLNESPSTYSNQGGSAKSGTCTGNQPFTDSNDGKKVSHSDTQIQVEADEADEGNKRDVCSYLFSSFNK